MTYDEKATRRPGTVPRALLPACAEDGEVAVENGRSYSLRMRVLSSKPDHVVCAVYSSAHGEAEPTPAVVTPPLGCEGESIPAFVPSLCGGSG